MAEKALMALVYELSVRGVPIPFNEAAHRLQPGSSGSSFQQYLGRTRNTLIAEGHMVPPPFGKAVGPTIRGYVREFPNDPNKLTQARSLGWGEQFEHSKYNLVDAVNLVHGGKGRQPSQVDLGDPSSSAVAPDQGFGSSSGSGSQPGDEFGTEEERNADFVAKICQLVSEYQPQSRVAQPQPQSAQPSTADGPEPAADGSPSHH